MQIIFLTLNVWNGGKLFDEIVAFIKKEDPDIVALQEMYNGTDPSLERQYRSFSEFKNALGYEHASFSPAFLDHLPPLPVEQGNAIYSKYPILSTVTTF